MGIITDTIRLHQLHGEKLDLQFKIQQITMTKMSLAHSCNDLLQVGTDYDPDSPVMKTLQQRQAKMKLMEEKLAHEMEQYQVSLDMVEAEYKSCKERLRQNIQEEFSYSFG